MSLGLDNYASYVPSQMEKTKKTEPAPPPQPNFMKSEFNPGFPAARPPSRRTTAANPPNK